MLVSMRHYVRCMPDGVIAGITIPAAALCIPRGRGWEVVPCSPLLLSHPASRRGCAWCRIACATLGVCLGRCGERNQVECQNRADRNGQIRREASAIHLTGRTGVIGDGPMRKQCNHSTRMESQAMRREM
ncbi:hypothetical protein LIA77_04858 [Sarocladium implicatum]|nr:hypothetical protein LIA77_04858 [Sarocladium implicatum]